MKHEWLGDLEERIHQATAELRRLRQENQRLSARVGELEAERGEDADGDSWPAEREQIRQRVESLAEGLERLLEEGEEADE